MARTNASLVFFGGIKILLAARPSDFKILIGRGEGSCGGGGGGEVGRGRDPASVENRVWRVRAGSPETTQRFQIADPISVHRLIPPRCFASVASVPLSGR